MGARRVRAAGVRATGARVDGWGVDERVISSGKKDKAAARVVEADTKEGRRADRQRRRKKKAGG